MIHVNLHFRTPGDHTSFYRALGPMMDLTKKDPAIKMNVMKEKPEWYDMMTTDVAFVHRPFVEEDIEIMHTYKRHGIPVWIDYDDDFLSVLRDSSAHKLLGSEESKQRTKRALAMADVVTVSTNTLKDVYAKYCKRIDVIPNAMPEYLMQLKRKPSTSRIILWRGNQTHIRDIKTVETAIINMAMDRKEWTWVFMGHDPWEITEYMDKNGIKNIYVPWTRSIAAYHDTLMKCKPEIVIAPLADHAFNRAKSNIAWMEGILAGAVTLAPAFDEWAVPGCVNYSDAAGFEANLFDMMTHPEVLPEQNEAGWEYIKGDLTLGLVNTARSNILWEFYGGKK